MCDSAACPLHCNACELNDGAVVCTEGQCEAGYGLKSDKSCGGAFTASRLVLSVHIET